MKKILVLFALCVGVTACDKKEPEQSPMQCGGYEVTIEHTDNDNLHAVISGDAVDLTRAKSADGEKYDGVLNDTDVSLWQAGGIWHLLLSDEAPIECM